MKQLRRFFLLTISVALMLEAQGTGDAWSDFSWRFHANMSSWIDFNAFFAAFKLPTKVHVIISLLELCLIVCALFWLGGTARQRRRRARRATRGITPDAAAGAAPDTVRGTLTRPLIVFAALLAAGVLYGYTQHGENFTIALWEMRGFAMLLAAYALAGIFLRGADDLDRFVWVVLLSATALAIENILRWLIVLRALSSYDLAYDHGDALILAFAAVLCVSLLFFRGTRAQRRYAAYLLPLLVVCMALMERRVAFALVAVGLIVCAIFVYRVRPRTFWKICLPLAMVGGIYLAVFWQNTSIFGQPARAISSLFSPDTRDYASNIYRDLEKYDITLNIQSAPATGLGFGQPFIFYVPLPDLSFWPFWHYTPHNSVLWLWMKDGALGFAAFWWLLGRASYDGSSALETQRERWAVLGAALQDMERRREGARAARRKGASPLALTWVVIRPISVSAAEAMSAPPPVHVAPRPMSRRARRKPLVDARASGVVALLVTCVALVPMLVTFAYVDLGLTNERVMLLVGLVLGILARAQIPLAIPVEPSTPPRRPRAGSRPGHVPAGPPKLLPPPTEAPEFAPAHRSRASAARPALRHQAQQQAQQQARAPGESTAR